MEVGSHSLLQKIFLTQESNPGLCIAGRFFIMSTREAKEIKQVNPKGDQPWIFIWRTDAEVEALILWPPDAKNWLIGKDPDAGKDGRPEKGMTEDETVG